MFLSPEFQTSLNAARLDIPADVAYGSHISIRHQNTYSYLHSHNHLYRNGSKQQQVTVYPEKDANNIWIIENQSSSGPDDDMKHFTGADISPLYVEDEAVIRLRHITTNRRLHTHDVPAPITIGDNEVSAYGHRSYDGDDNDLFQVEIDRLYSESTTAMTRLKAIQSRFRLVHLSTGCMLCSQEVKLPEWGFEQQEVTCSFEDSPYSNTIWYIEGNLHPLTTETAERTDYRKIGFLQKFLELHKVMWKHNAGLVRPHPWASRPSSWPILRSGINFWLLNNRQIYLIGNPFVWWSSTGAIGSYIVINIVAVLRWQRGYPSFDATLERFSYEVGVIVLGWTLHYVPFYFMTRSLFLHHYLPALYFAVIAFCQLYDFVIYHWKIFGINRAMGESIGGCFITVAITFFVVYSPLTYGTVWNRELCNRFKLISSWNIGCDRFDLVASL